MADDVREEDEWLYGESDGLANLKREREQTSQEFEDDGSQPQTAERGDFIADEESREKTEDITGQADGQEDEDDDEEDEDEDSDDDDDGVQVTIGEIKPPVPTPFGTAPTKRSGPPPDKKGKFSVEDFDSPGMINGVPALDFNVDSVEDKPWRKPGADITDYFNYGFTEDTWRAYCDRQKRMRFETGVGGLGPGMGGMGPMNPTGKVDSRGIIAVQINNDNSKYGGSGNAAIVFPKKFGMMNVMRKDDIRRREEPKENTIQVMTADRREYSRKNFDMPPPPHVPPFAPPPFDTSVPPPPFAPPGPEYMPNPEYFSHPPRQYHHEEYSGYDDQPQWMEGGWDMNMDMSRPPPAVVSLTKASNVPPPPGEGDSTPPSIKDEKSD